MLPDETTVGLSSDQDGMSPRPTTLLIQGVNGFIALAMTVVLSFVPEVRASPFECEFSMRFQGPLQTIHIGVLDLDANNVDQDISASISARLRAFLSQQSVFDVMERKRMNDLLEAQNFQLSGACVLDDRCAAQVGEIVGVNKMVAGEVSVTGSIYSLQVRLIDVTTSRVEYHTYRDVSSIEQVLLIATREVAEELAQMAQGASRLTVYSYYSGAQLRVSGLDDRIRNLKLAEETVLLTPGAYRIVVDAPGYRRFRRDIDIKRSETITLPVMLTPKRRSSAAFLSLLVPGIGQLYEGRTGMGAFTFTIHAGIGYLLLNTLKTYSNNRSDYRNLQTAFFEATTPAEIAQLQSAIKGKHIELEQSAEDVDLYVKVLGSLWLANVFDATVNMPRLRRIPSPQVSLGVSPDLRRGMVVVRIIL